MVASMAGHASLHACVTLLYRFLEEPKFCVENFGAITP